MKISKTQMDVLKRMANGETLTRNTTMDGACHIAGDRIRYDTFFALWKKGLIKSKTGRRFPYEEYVLTEKSKELLEVENAIE